MRRPLGRRRGTPPRPIARWVLGALLGAALPLGAQETAALRGRVLDETSGAPVAGATVVLLDGDGRQLGETMASTSGAFALRASRAAARAVAAGVGFASDTLDVPGDGSSLTIRLAAAPLAMDPVIVDVDRSFSAASSDLIRQVDIRLRPRESSQELLRLVPGLVIAQHAGGGKAEQIFLRGFDADHGTDVAISVDGTPVNMVSHAHGQGYADLHFLIPEVVEEIDVRKGPHDAEDGDFATAGAVAFRTLDRLPEGLAGVRGGSFDTGHALSLIPLGGPAGESGGYLAATGITTRGPFDEPQDYRRLNGFGKWTAPVGGGAELVATASGFGARWDASGQIPERAVTAGLIDRFGAIDPTEGGDTQRYDLSAGVRSNGEGIAQWEARAYGVRYLFALFSNFTFFLNDQVNGDGIEQVDDRLTLGLQARYARPTSLLGRTGGVAAGIDLRHDRSDIALYDQVRRRRLDARVDDHLEEDRLSAWGRHDWNLSDRVRLQLGLRGDLFRFGIEDRLADTPSDLAHASGVEWQGIVSPKASLAVDLTSSTSLFANAGSGFHSNDARDVILAGRADRVLPRAVGAELGARHTWSGGSVAAAAWGLDLGSELVYVGDEGTTEASGRTRRIGLDLEARLRLAPWLWADGDLTVSRGRLRDEPEGADRIPLAPTRVAVGGLTVRDLGPLGGGLRVRHVGSRAADETGSVVARGYTLWEVLGTWRFPRFDVVVAVDNLFDTDWNEAQFATTSRLAEEVAPVTELHFTPGAPRSLQAGIVYRF